MSQTIMATTSCDQTFAWLSVYFINRWFNLPESRVTYIHSGISKYTRVRSSIGDILYVSFSNPRSIYCYVQLVLAYITFISLAILSSLAFSSSLCFCSRSWMCWLIKLLFPTKEYKEQVIICRLVDTHTHTHTHTHARTHAHTCTHTHNHTHTHTHSHTCTHAHTHTHTHTHTYTHIHTHAHTDTHTYIRTHTYTHTLIHTYTNTHTHTYTHMHTNIHIHTHTHIHTYTHTCNHRYVSCCDIPLLWVLSNLAVIYGCFSCTIILNTV